MLLTERVLSQSKEHKRQNGKSEKNEMQVPESDQTNRCQMRLKSVGWTGISHNSAITLAHYPAKAWHNVCITLHCFDRTGDKLHTCRWQMMKNVAVWSFFAHDLIMSLQKGGKKTQAIQYVVHICPYNS